MPFIYFSKAKINLFLSICDRDKEGYHCLESLVCFSSIADKISVELAQDFSLTTTGEFQNYLPITNNNLIAKVFFYFKKKFKIKDNVKILLEKNIPIGAGIGGGSSNAAIFILAMNELFRLQLKEKQLIDIATVFGSDVPVCLKQKATFFESRGEILRNATIPKVFAILINPRKPLGTREVFQKFEGNFTKKISKEIKRDLEFSNLFSLISFLEKTDNDLTNAAISLSFDIENILKELKGTFPLIARMSGSGATCFAIYKDEKHSKEAFLSLQKSLPDYWIKQCTFS